MRKSSRRDSQIETFEKMLLMSASGIDGFTDAEFVEGPEADEIQEVEFSVPFGESVLADLPETAPEPLSSNDAFLDRVVELTNEVRAANGLKALTTNSALQATAQLQSVNMAEQDFFSHTGQDGLMAWDRALEEGYNYQTIGENIAAGQLTPEEVVQGWVNSPGHLANILNPRFTEIGVGYEYLQTDTGVINYHHYWTQVFGTEFPSVEDEIAVEPPEGNEPVEENSAVDVPPPAIEIEPPTAIPEPAPPEAVEEVSQPVPEAPSTTELDPPTLEVEPTSPPVEFETAPDPAQAEPVEVAPVPGETDEPAIDVTKPAPVDVPPPAQAEPAATETETSPPETRPIEQTAPTEVRSPANEVESSNTGEEAANITPPAIEPVNVATPVEEIKEVTPPEIPAEPRPEAIKAPASDTTPADPSVPAEAPTVDQVKPASAVDEVAITDIETADQNSPEEVVTTEPEPTEIAPATKATPPAVVEQITPLTLEPAITVDSNPAAKQNHKFIPQAVAEQVFDVIEKLKEKGPAAIQDRVAEIASRLTNIAEIDFFDQAAQHELTFSSRSQAANDISQMITGKFSAGHSWLNSHKNEGHSNHLVRQILNGFRAKHEDADDDHDLNEKSELTADSIL